jgi:trans-aconitate methyltransferase
VTLPRSYFDRIYEADADPWGFADRWYEERKRALTLAALPDRRYRSAFEPGCSIGVLTSDLARRCDNLLASDVAASALTQAAARVSDQPQVEVRQLRVPDEWPDQEFELIVLSEILYYLDDGALVATAEKAVGGIALHGTLVSVHWRHPVSDYPQTGDVVQERVAEAARGRLVQTVHHVEADFDLAVYVRPLAEESVDRVSVAGRAGLC